MNQLNSVGVQRDAPIQMAQSAPTRLAAGQANRAAARALAEDPFLNAREAAAETGRAVSTFWRDVKLGALPRPTYVTPRSPRWRQSELRAVVTALPRAPTNNRRKTGASVEGGVRYDR